MTRHVMESGACFVNLHTQNKNLALAVDHEFCISDRKVKILFAESISPIFSGNAQAVMASEVAGSAAKLFPACLQTTY